MKTFAVIGGRNYEGEDFDSLRLFECFFVAVDYLKSLESDFDYVDMQQLTISQQSHLD